MLKCKMIDSIGQSDYIAAGRTDKGVHAVNNVFSIIGKFLLQIEFCSILYLFEKR